MWSTPSDTRAAMPKSITRARPSGSSRMFDGFRSRCTMPCACAARSASSTPRNSVTAARGVIAPPARNASASVRPRTSSNTRYGWPSASSASNTGTMFGCDRRLTARASCSHWFTDSVSAPGRQQLERHLALEPLVVRTPYGGLRAATQRVDQHEAADACAGCGRAADGANAAARSGAFMWRSATSPRRRGRRARRAATGLARPSADRAG